MAFAAQPDMRGTVGIAVETHPAFELALEIELAGHVDGFDVLDRFDGLAYGIGGRRPFVKDDHAHEDRDDDNRRLLTTPSGVPATRSEARWATTRCPSCAVYGSADSMRGILSEEICGKS